MHANAAGINYVIRHELYDKSGTVNVNAVRWS